MVFHLDSILQASLIFLVGDLKESNETIKYIGVSVSFDYIVAQRTKCYAWRYRKVV